MNENLVCGWKVTRKKKFNWKPHRMIVVTSATKIWKMEKWRKKKKKEKVHEWMHTNVSFSSHLFFVEFPNDTVLHFVLQNVCYSSPNCLDKAMRKKTQCTKWWMRALLSIFDERLSTCETQTHSKIAKSLIIFSRDNWLAHSTFIRNAFAWNKAFV